MQRKNIYRRILFTVYCLLPARIILTLMIAGGFTVFAFSQTVTPTYIGTTGNYSTMGGSPFWSISSSVGEPMTTTVSSSSITLTQGFQQPQNCPALSVSTPFFVSNDSVCPGTSVTITPNITGNPPYTYSWAPGGFTTSAITVNPTVTTTYFFSVYQGILSCGDSSSVTVTVNQPPAVNSIGSSPNPICSGQSTNVGAIAMGGLPPYTYLWNPSSQTTSSFSVTLTSTTTYSLIVSGADGCASTATTSVTVNPKPIADINGNNNPPPLTICSGTNQVLAVTTGTGLTYLWNPGGQTTSSITVSPAAATTYTVIITTTSGCSDTLTQIVNVNPTPTVTATGNATICEGNSTPLAASGATTYSWSPAAGLNNFAISNPIATPSISTTYTVTGATLGCPDTATVSVTVKPIPTLSVSSSPGTICSGQSTSISVTATFGGGAPYTYFWNPSSQTTSGFSVTLTNTTTYTVSVAGLSGCITTATTTATVNPTPTVTVTYSAGAAICLGDSSVLTASGGTTYSWWTFPAQTTVSITVSPTLTTIYTLIGTSSFGCSDTVSYMLTVNPTPTATTNVNNASCNNMCNGDATVTASGGTSPYTYLWNDPGNQTTLTASGLCAGNYTSTVTDQNGCSVTDTVSITQPAAFSTTVSATSACNSVANGTASVSVTGGNAPYSYLWNPSSQTTSTATNLAAANYSVDITDANGCTGSATVTVSSAMVTASITASATTICSGSNATLTASGGSVYTWSSGQNSSVIIVSPANTTAYTATVTTSGCSDIASVTVTVTTAPVASVTITPSSTICSGTTITLSAGGGTTYSWQSAQTTGTNPTVVISPNTSFTYTLVAYNGSCTDTIVDSIVVTTVSASISGTNTACVGGTITLNASSNGTIFSWSGPNSFSSTLQNIAITNATTSSAGTYTVIVSDTTGCSGVATTSVSVNPLPTPAIATTTTSICVGYGSATLTASGGNTYSWSTTATTTSIIVSSWVAGNYNYTVTAYNGLCSADTSITITVLPLPSIQVTSSDTTVCPGDAVTLTASIPSGALGYQWTGYGVNVNPIVVYPTVSSTYTVGGMGLNGCGNQITFTEIINIISVNAGNDVTICPGFTAHLEAIVSGDTAGATYLWSPFDGSLNDSSVYNPSANPDSTTVYALEVFNGNGCWAKDTVTVFIVRTAECVIHVYNGITPNGDGANDIWYIDGIQSFPDNLVSIFNRWGNKVWQGKHYDNDKVVWKGTNQNGEALPDGTYYYNIELYDTDGSVLYTATKWVEITH